MSDWISREAAVAICDEAACETDSESARYEMFRARAAIRALPAVQPDAAAILQERPDSLDRVARAICLASYGDANPVPVPDELMPNAWERLRDRYALLAEAAILALIDNAGKEVMPDAAQSPPAGHDIGPGDQAVAGAAPRRASGPIDSDAGFATSGAEARWIADIDAGVYDDAQPEPWPSAAIREAALREAADSLLECSVWCDGQERTDDGWRNGVADARKHHTARILALIDNPRKEVMPPVPVIDATNASDIGPGDQAVAGAAAYPALREAIHKMVGLYETGDRSTYSACPQSAILAIAFLDDYEARNRPAPKLLVDDCDIALTWEVGGWKLYQYCDAEESISFRWIGTPIAARPEPVAPPPPWPEGLIHLTNTRRFHVDCATEGCGRRVRTRFAGSDYCEPCGRKVATEGGA